jgi:hypothetical protein
LLDANAIDQALAARLAHLEVHLRDKLGDGCGAGLKVALASELHAHEREAVVRQHFGLEAESADTHASTADYLSRCAR